MNPGDFPARTPMTAALPLGAGAWKTTVCAERGHREPHLASAASFSRNAKKKKVTDLAFYFTKPLCSGGGYKKMFL